MKDKKAIKHLKKLGKYCTEKTLCTGCVFTDLKKGDIASRKCPISSALAEAERKELI